MDAHKNLAITTVATAPSPAASGTSLTVSAGTGSRFPAVPFNATIWPAATLPDPTNAEIVRVTNIAGDVLTITRAQEGTSARSVIVSDQIALAITAKVLTDIEAAVDALSNVVSDALSAGVVASNLLSNLISAHDVLSNRVSANSGTGGAGSVTSNEVSAGDAATSAQAASALSQAISVISQQFSVVSQNISVISNKLSNEISNRTSADNALSQAISVLSQGHSVLSQGVSVLSVHVDTVSNALSNEISNRTSADNALSNVISNVLSAHNALSNIVSDSLSAGVVASNLVSNLASAVSGISQLLSTLRGGTTGQVLKKSANGDYLWTWAADATGGSGSATVTSNEISIISQALSVHSQAISVLSQQVSVITAALSNLTSAHDALSNVVSNAQSAGDVISQQVSVLSQQVSVISVGIGAPQMKVLANATTVSATSFANVSGMSISVTSAATYRIEGLFLHTVSTVNVVAMGFTFPAGITPGALMMDGQISTEAGGQLGFASGFVNHGYINDTGMSTVATAILSVTYGASATTYLTHVYGVLRTGANAGTIQLQVKNSAAATSITFKQGSFLQAFKIQ